MKKLLTQLPKAMLLLLVMLVFVQVNAQKRYAPLGSTNFRYTIENDVQISSKILEFDLYLKALNPSVDSVFELSSIQAGVYVTKAISAGTMTATYTASGLPSAMRGTITYATGTPQGCIKIAAKAGPGCGLGQTISKDEPGTLLYHVRLTSTTDFVAGSKANLNFSFTTVPYKTAVWQYYVPYPSPCAQLALLTDATNTYAGANYHNIVLNAAAPTVFAVTGGGAYCEGTTSNVPVGLAGSQLGVVYTLLQDGISIGTFDGTGSALAFGNQLGALAPGFTYTVTAKYYGTFYTVQTPMGGSAIVTITPKPVITFAPLADACVGTAAITLTATPTGGVYSGNSYLSGSTFNPSTLGTYDITYNVSVGGCAAVPVTQPINVITCGPVIPTWSGAVSTVWAHPLNWNDGNVPDYGDDVIIPTGCPYYPVLISGQIINVGNLDVSGGAAKSTLTGGFTIGGTLIVGGTLTITGGGSVDIATGGALTVDGNLNIAGSLTVENVASLITYGGVTGTATVKRCITGDLAWHFLSSPVNSQLICNGVFAPVSLPFTGCNWDFYKWNPYCNAPVPDPLGWRNLRDGLGNLNTADFGTTPAFEVTKGYLVAYGDCFTECKSFVGTPNTGTKDVLFTDLFYDCWWLAGNPYPSAIDWTQVTHKENLISGYYYVWNDAIQGYEYWLNGGHLSSSAVNGYIPSMQGFFIRGNAAGGKYITIPNDARVHNVLNDYWLKDTPVNNTLNVTLANGTYSDKAIVMFENGSTVGKDWVDAEKMVSMNTEVPQVFTIVNNDMKTALNSMPFVNDGATIPVGVIAPAEGQFTMTVDLANFNQTTAVSLEDLKLNYTQNLRQNSVYTFSAVKGEDDSRFLLHFAGAIGIDNHSNSGISIYSNEKTVFITCAAGSQVTISNLLGQEILTQKLDQTQNQVKVNAIKGYYIVKVQSESTVKTAKVYIN
jgi:hypothetical protein